MKPVLFLDIDGVLNTSDSLARSSETDVRFEPRAVQALNDLLAHIEAEIVISSSWRLVGLPVSMQEIFRQNGIDSRWIRDQTPIGETRGAEILAWLGANGNRPYAVIDDELDHLTGIPVERIVHVEDGFAREGFTPAHARKAALVISATVQQRSLNQPAHAAGTRNGP